MSENFEPQGDISTRLSLEERIAHLEAHTSGLVMDLACRTCRFIKEGW